MTAKQLAMTLVASITTFGAVSAYSFVQTPQAKPDERAIALFESRIRPLLAERCFGCHGPAKQMAGLRLDSEAALLQGGASGPVIKRSFPAESRLLNALHYNGPLKMPPGGKLSESQIQDVAEWIRLGAPWGKSAPLVKTAPGADPEQAFIGDRKSFWSFQQVKRPAVPKPRNAAWVRNPIDAFVLSQLEKRGLKPAPPADRATLLRRAAFDLTGLPPTPEETAAFVADLRPDAYARLIDRLLASPAYGERWGRRWLDVVRYADSTDARGIGSEGDIAEAWRYRDWVVNALNRDMPYPEFVRQQLAGDLLAEEGGKYDPGRVIATSLLNIGNWGNGDADKDKILTDIVDDQIDVVTRGFLGVTIACARCHDHKFDPFSTRDYYGLAGIFFSTHILPKLTPKGAGENPLRVPLLSWEEQKRRADYTARLSSLEKRLGQESSVAFTNLARELQPKSAIYAQAAIEYSRRPVTMASMSVEKFAASRGLLPFALSQWMDYLGLGDYRRMTVAVKDILGSSGVLAYKGAADCPSITVNSNKEPRTLLSFTLPPRSVALHPGPSNGVAVSWQSPISGTVRVVGRVQKADPGGDGIGWIVDHKTSSGTLELASGETPGNGGQEFAKSRSADKLSSITIKEGEKLLLLVLPRDNYTCDTTTVELKIETLDGSKKWDLATDLVDNLHAGNPHADHYGAPGVWEFLDMAESRRAKRPSPAQNPALVQFEAAVASENADQLRKAAEQMGAALKPEDASNPFRPRGTADLSMLAEPIRRDLAEVIKQIAEMKATPLPPVEYANGALDGGVPESPHAGIHDVHVHIRGNYARLGDLVPRRFPTVISDSRTAPKMQGSGRVQLAEWIGNEKNPLTARVMVNRLWQGHFGEGIVRTANNFGFLGERPTNQPLLDWLAAEFMQPVTPSASPWSLKSIHRLIMLSATYQQSTRPDPKSLKLDPDNRWLSRMPRRRLESEAIRDNLLAVVGRLDRKMGGVSMRDFNLPRRSLYVMTVRSDRTGFGPLFDVADSTAVVEKRTVSTVAPQALYLLNSPFVLEQAGHLAARLTADQADPVAAIKRAYLLLYGREATAKEIAIGRQIVPESKDASPEAVKKRLEEWTAYCQILLCANEFIYVD